MAEKKKAADATAQKKDVAKKVSAAPKVQENNNDKEVEKLRNEITKLQCEVTKATAEAVEYKTSASVARKEADDLKAINKNLRVALDKKEAARRDLDIMAASLNNRIEAFNHLPWLKRLFKTRV